MPRNPRKVKLDDTARSTRLAEQRGQQEVLLFSRDDWTLYTSLAHLPQKAGVRASSLPRLIAKELGDNGLDAADAAGNPGAVQISVDGAGNLIVADQGTGIADATPEKIASLFCVARPMVSSKLLRRPTRGAVGNGLRVCLGFLTATGGSLVVETSNIRVSWRQRSTAPVASSVTKQLRASRG
jgi:hypothetical protein